MRTIYLLLCLLFIATGCDRPQCSNTNPVFNNNEPTTEVYKSELAKALKKNTAELDYYLASYHETDTFPYMIVHVQGSDFCAKAMVTIEKQDGDIAGIVKNKGAGYIGAELAGLKIAIVEQPGETQFMYNGLDEIVD